jgi:hypothetical protein
MTPCVARSVIWSSLNIEDDPVSDGEARAFRHRNVERCVVACAELSADTLVFRSDRHTPTELAELVFAAMRD